VRLLALLLVLLVAVPPAVAARPPDIVLLVLDDVGVTDDRIWERLPAIRQLFLEEGLVADQAIGNTPLCCPARATLLTGLRTRDHGVVRNDARLFDPRVTLATALDDRGYATALFGKYFNGYGRIGHAVPPGWDAFQAGGHYYDTTWWRKGDPVAIGTRVRDYTTDRIRQRAIGWIGRRRTNEPVFLYLAPFAAHGGNDRDGSMGLLGIPAQRHRGDARCAGIPPWSTPAHGEDIGDKPAWVRRRMATDTPSTSWDVRTTCETLLAVDELLAAVMDALARAGRADVLVLMVSDNGMSWGAHGLAAKHQPYALPVPLFLRWPRVLGDRPRRLASTISSLDIAPTLCAVAGCSLGPYPDGRTSPGIPIWRTLAGDAAATGRSVLPVEYAPQVRTRVIPGWRGIRTTEAHPLGRYLYVRYATGDEELYDLDADPWMLENRAYDPAYADELGVLVPEWERLHLPLYVGPAAEPTFHVVPSPGPNASSGPDGSPGPDAEAAEGD